MTYTPPTTYLFGWIASAKFHARIEHWEDFVSAMKKKEVIEFIDVDGERSVINAKYIDSIYISTPESRENSRAFFKWEEEENPPEEKDEPWK